MWGGGVEASVLAGALLAGLNLHRTYRLGRVNVPVLRGATITVNRGEWVAVLGASGSGKSTLLHLLGALDRPDPPPPHTSVVEGTSSVARTSATGAHNSCVFFEGESLGDMSHRRLNRYRNRHVGFVFQFYHLLPELNVLENTMLQGLVGLGMSSFKQKSELRTRATALLESFGLGHRLKHRPAELSGGERQRVAIARALLNKPDVLLADEPTGNLDERTGGEILDLIAAQHREAALTIVMVTHDQSIAKRADRVVRLHDGQVVEG